MCDLPLQWRRFQLDSNGITKAHVTIYVNDDGEPRETARMALTEDESQYINGEIEHALYMIAHAREAKERAAHTPAEGGEG